MIFCDECYNCLGRVLIERDEHILAKDFWRKYQSSYIFACGAYFNPHVDPGVGFIEVHRGRGCMKGVSRK